MTDRQGQGTSVKQWGKQRPPLHKSPLQSFPVLARTGSGKLGLVPAAGGALLKEGVWEDRGEESEEGRNQQS